MPNRIADITRSLRELGEVQINEWDFMELLNTNIKDLEIGDSLRKLGNRRVIDWDFKTAMPAVHRLAHKEVRLGRLMKRRTNEVVMDSNLKNTPAVEPSTLPIDASKQTAKTPKGDEMKALAERLRNYLHYVVVNLIDEPDKAEIRFRETQQGVIHFKLLVSQNDVKDLIGRDGQTGAAIRSLLKASAAANGAKALLEILSREEEMAMTGENPINPPHAPA